MSTYFTPPYYITLAVFPSNFLSIQFHQCGVLTDPNSYTTLQQHDSVGTEEKLETYAINLCILEIIILLMPLLGKTY